MPYYGRNDPMPPFWGHSEPVPTIDADTAAKAVEAGALIIDLGQPQDWFRAHIKGALLVEPELLDMDLNDIPKERPIIVASRSNSLTDEVVDVLNDHGFDAAALAGGIAAWEAAGYEVASTRR
jgi:rhodanese-related sulfurtransferase